MRNGISLILLIASLVLTNAFSEELYDDSVNVELLKEAWKIPAGGSNGKPYYSLWVNGVYLQGERKWEERWELIKDAMNYENQRILDIGCNSCLASVFLLKYRNAASATGVDRSQESLNQFGTPRLIEAAKLVQQAFNVGMDIILTDLNDSNYEQLIGTHHDVVIAMSILKWVNDKERFLKFLANFNHVIFEGHESDEVEICRFQRHGFTGYEILGSTQIGISYPADAKRTVIHFFK